MEVKNATKRACNLGRDKPIEEERNWVEEYALRVRKFSGMKDLGGRNYIPPSDYRKAVDRVYERCRHLDKKGQRNGFNYFMKTVFLYGDRGAALKVLNNAMSIRNNSLTKSPRGRFSGLYNSVNSNGTSHIPNFEELLTLAKGKLIYEASLDANEEARLKYYQRGRNEGWFDEPPEKTKDDRYPDIDLKHIFGL